MIRSTANTNAWIYAGKLWAMKEDSPALVMDPVTMETIGFEKFGGKMTGQTFTAHPKIDPEDRQHGRDRLCSAAACAPTMCAYYEVSPKASWFAKSGSRCPIIA